MERNGTRFWLTWKYFKRTHLTIDMKTMVLMLVERQGFFV